MNQFNWTYLSETGRQYHVGMYHGAESGHLLIYCNNEIILVDFSVLRSATYSFFIEDQLCELEIELTGGKFLYGFHVNKTADTPLNRQRKKKEKQYLLQSLAFIAALIIGMSLFIYASSYWNRTKDAEAISTLLQEFGKETNAKILIASENEDHSISYYFIVNGKGYTVRTQSNMRQMQLFRYGMPIEEGDEFVVRYLPENPNTCSINYNKPSPRQIKTYLERAVAKYLSNNPELSKEQSECLGQLVFELKGLEGIADMYFHDAPTYDNPKHNRESFKRLFEDFFFQQKLKDYCSL